jgi:predicted nuclease of restriction endonuclease-like (RecB) superfamily
MSKIQQSDYQDFIKEIKQKIYLSQLEALQAVNKELLQLYWEIGKSIVEKQEQFGWGISVVESLSKELQTGFPGTQGFSTQNLWRMRKFYLEYKENEKLAPLVREIGWSHRKSFHNHLRYSTNLMFQIGISSCRTLALSIGTLNLLKPLAHFLHP